MVLLLSLAAAAEALPPARLRSELERPISKRVARDSSGRIYLLTLAAEGGSSPLELRVGPPSAEAWADFSPAGNPGGKFSPKENMLSAGMVIDRQDRLHLVWTTVGGATVLCTGGLPSADGPGSEMIVIGAGGSRVGDITRGSDDTVAVTWTTTAPTHQSTLYLGVQRDRQWRSYAVAAGYGYFPASLTLDRHGTFTLGWNDVYEDSWTLSLPAGALGSSALPAPRRVAGAEGGPWMQNYGGYRPVVAETPAGLIAARENWLNRLEYFRPDADPHPLTSVTAGDARFAWDSVYAPQFATDGYGIPWLFFIDSARASVFYTRWLGTRWSPFGTAGKITRNSPRMEDGHLPIDRIAVEERLQAGQHGLGVLIENDSTTPAVAFRRLAVPTLAADPGRKLLFLDLEELAAVDGIAQPLNPPRKQGQVLAAAPPGRPDSDYIGPPVRVLKQGGKYRMWYAGRWKADNSDHWWEWYHALYAESSDGRTFQRAKLGLVPFRGQTDTNLMPGLVLSHAVTGVGYDPTDPDPGRRYKFLRFPNSETFSAEARAGHTDPWSDSIAGQLLVSADGLKWSPLPASIDFPAGRPILGFIPQSLLPDPTARDPQKRYKAYGFSAFNKVRRTAALATSGDAQHWVFAPDNPVLDPLIGDTPPVHGGLVEQIHDIVAWRDGDYTLALYQYQHDGGNLDLRLAASRDGEHFTFIHPETPFIRAGRAGEWDSDQVNPSAPLIDDHELKFYYGAVRFEGGTESTQVKTYGGVGLATLRLDGLTDLQPEPGRATASFATIPVAPGKAADLVVNADCGPGQLALEIVDPATGQPLPGYARSDCQAVRGDGTAMAVRWRDHPGVGDLRQPYLIRVLFTGGAGFPKLYSIRFR